MSSGVLGHPQSWHQFLAWRGILDVSQNSWLLFHCTLCHLSTQSCRLCRNLDLNDAFFHIPILKTHCKFLCFFWRRKLSISCSSLWPLHGFIYFHEAGGGISAFEGDPDRILPWWHSHHWVIQEGVWYEHGNCPQGAEEIGFRQSLDKVFEKDFDTVLQVPGWIICAESCINVWEKSVPTKSDPKREIFCVLNKPQPKRKKTRFFVKCG